MPGHAGCLDAQPGAPADIALAWTTRPPSLLKPALQACKSPALKPPPLHLLVVVQALNELQSKPASELSADDFKRISELERQVAVREAACCAVSMHAACAGGGGGPRCMPAWFSFWPRVCASWVCFMRVVLLLLPAGMVPTGEGGHCTPSAVEGASRR